MHLGFFFKVVDRRRRGCGPFQGPRVPGIVASDFAMTVRNDEVVGEDENRYPLD
jgi:hypothetical protein